MRIVELVWRGLTANGHIADDMECAAIIFKKVIPFAPKLLTFGKTSSDYLPVPFHFRVFGDGKLETAPCGTYLVVEDPLGCRIKPP